MRCTLARQGDLLGEAGDGAPWLQPGERARLAGLGSPARRQSFLAGRWLARRLLAAALGGEAAAMPAEIDSLGRSHVPGAPGLNLSITHSGDWVAVALADAPVGIDLEGLRARGDLLALAAMVHSHAQCQAIAALDEAARLLAFYRCWTLKEAWLKRQGLGLDFARMRAQEYRAADDAEPAQALSWVDASRGLALALDGEGLDELDMPDGFGLMQRLRYSPQSTPKSK